MTASSVKSMAQSSVLRNISITDDDIYNLINLGVIDLYDTFNLSFGYEKIETVSVSKEFSIRNELYQTIVKITDDKGNELQLHKDYVMLDYRTFMLLTDKVAPYYTVMYKKAHEVVNSGDIEIAIPSVFLTALLCYIGYQVHIIVQVDNLVESDKHRIRYYEEISKLENRGYKNTLYSNDTTRNFNGIL